MASSERSEAVTAKPRFARPIAWVPMPHETSRTVRALFPSALDHTCELLGLPIETLVPVLKDQVIEARHSVVKLARQWKLRQGRNAGMRR